MVGDDDDGDHQQLDAVQLFGKRTPLERAKNNVRSTHVTGDWTLNTLMGARARKHIRSQHN